MRFWQARGPCWPTYSTLSGYLRSSILPPRTLVNRFFNHLYPASNICRIVAFIEAEAESTVGTSTRRERRRTDIDGKPLQRVVAA